MSVALRSVADLLTQEERDLLFADLAEMARLRRRAQDESAFIVVGSAVGLDTTQP